MLLELVVVAVAAAAVGATLALLWLQHRTPPTPPPLTEDQPPPWTTPELSPEPTTLPKPDSGLPVDLDWVHQPGQGLVHLPSVPVPGVPLTPHPRKPDGGGMCTKDLKPYCVDNVEYRGSCELAERIFPSGSIKKPGFCTGPALRTWTD